MQCGRFHDIGEFDGEKRSCRTRLQRHNARRRRKGAGNVQQKPGRKKRKAKSAQNNDSEEDDELQLQVLLLEHCQREQLLRLLDKFDVCLQSEKLSV